MDSDQITNYIKELFEATDYQAMGELEKRLFINKVFEEIKESKDFHKACKYCGM